MGIRVGVGLPGPFFVSAGRNGQMQDSKASRECDRAMKYAIKVVQSDVFLSGIDVTREEPVEFGVGAAAETLVDAYLRKPGQHNAAITDAADDLQWRWYDCKVRGWTGDY